MTDILSLHEYVLADIKKKYPNILPTANQPIGHGLTADFSLALSNDVVVLVEIKGSRVTTEDIAHFNLIRTLLPKDKSSILLFYAPIFPHRIRELALELGIELVTIPKELELTDVIDRPSGRMIRITTPSAWRVVHHFIVNGPSSINRAAQATKTSYSWAHRVVQDLLAQNLIERKGRASFKIIDLGKLINGIAWERPFKELVVKEWQASSISLTDVLHDIVDADPDAVITGYYAVQEYGDFARRVDLVQVYSRNHQELERHLGRSDNGIKISVLQPDRVIESVKATRLGFEGIRVVAPIQLVLDLAGLGFAAQDLLQQILGELKDETR
jgi:hypothetical protein